MTKRNHANGTLFGTALSLVAPGSGHVMVGERRRGFILLSASLVAFVIMYLGAALETRAGTLLGVGAPALWLLCVHVYAMVDFQRASHRAAAPILAPSLLVTAVVVVGMLYPCGLALAANENLLMVAYVPTASMKPTIADGEFVVVNRLAARRPPGRGEVVVFRSPESDALWIKRVIGLPGDRVEQRDGRLFVNGAPLAAAGGDGPVMESLDGRSWRALTRPPGEAGVHEVPRGCCFVMGDHRANSRDSRHIGPVPLSDVEGVVPGL